MSHLSSDELRTWYERGGTGDRVRVIAHLAECETCRRALSALAAAAEPDPTATPAISVADVVSLGYAARKETGVRGSWLWHHPIVRLAAAAAVVVAVVWAATPTVNQTRSRAVQVVPTEGLSTAHEFRWETPFAAARYRVTLRDTTGVLVFTGEVSESPFRPDDSLRAQLKVGGHYSWKVESLDASGTVIAQSVPVTFEFHR